LSKREKLIEKWRNATDYEEYETVEKLLNYYGYFAKGIGSSHCTFRKENRMLITVPKENNRVKPIYLKQIICLLEERGEI